MQLSTFLSDSRIEQPYGGEEVIVGEAALKARTSLIRSGDLFDCPKCDWKSASSSHATTSSINASSPPSDTVDTASKASLHSLSDEVLLVLISHLDTPSLLVFEKVFGKVAKLVNETNVSLLPVFDAPSIMTLREGNRPTRSAMLCDEARTARSDPWSGHTIRQEEKSVDVLLRLHIEARLR